MTSTLRAVSVPAAVVLALLLTSTADARRQKVTICHKGQEISISERAVNAHLRNHEGDHLGACEEDEACPCWTADEVREAFEAAVEADANVDCHGAISRYSEDDEFFFFEEFFIGLFGATWGEVEYERYDGEVFSECEIFIDRGGAGFGPDPIQVDDISLDEAVACRQAIVDACPALIP